MWLTLRDQSKIKEIMNDLYRTFNKVVNLYEGSQAMLEVKNHPPSWDKYLGENNKVGQSDSEKPYKFLINFSQFKSSY